MITEINSFFNIKILCKNICKLVVLNRHNIQYIDSKKMILKKVSKIAKKVLTREV